MGVRDAIAAPSKEDNEKLLADLTEAVTPGLLRGLARALRGATPDMTRGLDGVASRKDVLGRLVEELAGRAAHAFVARSTQQLTAALAAVCRARWP